MAFHPSSPPSEGGADSYSYEDTPDTRLTSFSPLDSNSSQSSRLFHSFNLDTGKVDGQLHEFEYPSSTIHRKVSLDSLASVVHDKDPFITSTPEKHQNRQQSQNQNQNQNQTKLSATASAFQPLSAAPIVANGASNGVATPKPLGRFREVGTIAQSPNTGMRVYTNVPLSPTFSHDLKLSRSMCITSTSGVITNESVKEYFTVCSADCLL